MGSHCCSGHDRGAGTGWAHGATRNTLPVMKNSTIRSEQNALNTPNGLEQYRDWNRRNEDAAAQANRGQIALGLGGLTTLAGLIWVLSVDYAVPATALNVDQPSLAIGGEF